MSAATWRDSWGDEFTDFDAWERAGDPPGFVWGVNWADAYPGLRYVAESAEARRWAQAVGHDMHEVLLETNTFVLRLVCHDLVVTELPAEDDR